MRQIPNQSFTIRQATHADCLGILECLQLAFAAYRDQYPPEAFLDTVLSLETLRRRMTQMTLFVAVVGDEIVGTIACGPVNNIEGHLRGMAVRPESQGSGIGQGLLDAACNELRRSGCEIVTLDTTLPLQRAIRFYEKNGFQPTGRVGNFFGMSLFEYSKPL